MTTAARRRGTLPLAAEFGILAGPKISDAIFYEYKDAPSLIFVKGPLNIR